MDQERFSPETSPIESLKSQLLLSCSVIPLDVWKNRFPEMQIPLSENINSPLLPGDYQLDIENRTRYTRGHNVVMIFLARNGRVLVKLVHFDSDNPEAGKRYPDEFLGEADEKTYREVFWKAWQSLDRLVKDIIEQSSRKSDL